MIEGPTAGEIAGAVAAWLADGAEGGAFARRVAARALAIVERELAVADRLAAIECNYLHPIVGSADGDGGRSGLLVELLRSGTLAPLDPALLAYYRASTDFRLAIDQPSYVPAV